MLQSELFELLEHTADAAYAVSADGEIRSWNGAATRLFGHGVEEALGRNVDELLDARDALGTDALAGGQEAATRSWDGEPGGIPNFDLEVRTAAGPRVWVNVSTIVFDDRRTGERLFVRLARDIGNHHRREELLDHAMEAARRLVALAGDASSASASDHAPVEPLSEQERRILTLLARGRNPATVARRLQISPQTLRNHLHHINRKLRTHNRLEAVTHALRRGLIG